MCLKFNEIKKEGHFYECPFIFLNLKIQILVIKKIIIPINTIVIMFIIESSFLFLIVLII